MNNKKITAKPLVLWFLNSDLREDRLRTQILAMKQKGVGGFFMHWIDCEEPYMSEKWLQALDFIIEEAKKQEMEAWLYDEAWCPSCFAGGRILARRPDLQLKTIWCKKIDVFGGQEVSFDFELMKILRVCAVPLKAGTPVLDKAIDLSSSLGTVASGARTPYRHKKGYYPNVEPIEHWRNSGSDHIWRLKWQPPVGEWRVYVFCIRDMFTHEGMNRLDVLNPESIELFLEETHEVYAKRFEKYFGNVIPGIMTDEPKYWPMPWTDSLEEIFEQQYDTAFTEILPKLFDDSFPESSAVKNAYHKITSDMFRENYIVPMKKWCGEHNLLLTGHVSPEECLHEEMMYVGSIPRLLENFDIPGTDLIIQTVGDRNNMALNLGTKMASSVASQQGKNEVFVEYGACCNENFSLEQSKHMTDWLMVTGCNMLCNHGFSYSLESTRKYTTGLTLAMGMRLWKHWNIMTEYIENRCALLREYRPKNKVAVLKPQTSIRACSGNYEQVELQYIELVTTLMRAHIGFDFIDEDNATDWVCDNGILKCGCAEYSTIIIPSLQYITKACAGKLSCYALQGGELLAVDKAPVVLEFSGQQEWIGGFKDCALQDLAQLLKPDVDISGTDNEDVFVYRGENDSGDELLFLVNMLDKSVHLRCNGVDLSLPALGSFMSQVDSVNQKKTTADRKITLNKNWQVSAAKLNHIPINQNIARFKMEPGVQELYLCFEAEEAEKLAGSLYINGVKPDLKTGVPGFIYDDSNRLLQLKVQSDELIIEYDNSDFATVLIAGCFTAFRKNNFWLLSPKKNRAAALDSIACGYPFFSGMLEFSTNINLKKDLPNAVLELPGRSGVAEVWLDGICKGTCAWAPDGIHIGEMKSGKHRLELQFSGTVTGILKDLPEKFGIEGFPQLLFSANACKRSKTSESVMKIC